MTFFFDWHNTDLNFNAFVMCEYDSIHSFEFYFNLSIIRVNANLIKHFRDSSHEPILFDCQ